MKVQPFVLLFVGIASILPITTSTSFSSRVAEKRILDTLLDPKVYDKRIRPNAYSGYSNGTSETNKAILNTINIFLRNVEFICSKRHQWRAQITLRQEWSDARLVYDPSSSRLRYLTLQDDSRIWLPDLFFMNELDGSKQGVFGEQKLIRIRPNGDVLYSRRIIVTLSCPMSLSRYPWDSQLCPVVLASYGMTTDDLVLTWKDYQAIQLKDNIQLPNFVLTGTKTDSTVHSTTTGVYSVIKAHFEFKRRTGEFWIRIITPCVFFVILSYISLWLNTFSQRLSMSLLCLLFLSLLIHLESTNLPRWDGSKAIDVWTGCCLTFSFAALLCVLGLENYARYLASRKKISGKDTEKQAEQATSTGESGESAEESRKKQSPGNRLPLDTVESAVRALYPLIFLSYTLVFLLYQSRSSRILN